MEEKDLQLQVATIENQVDSMVVAGKEDYAMAGQMVINISEFIKQIQIYWKTPIEQAHKTHKELTKKRAEMLGPLEKQKTLLKQKVNKYLTEEENKRREAQRKLDEEREKKEAAERKRLADRAAKAEEKGKIEKAEELREQAENVYISPAVVQPEVEKTTRMETGTASTTQDIEVTITADMPVLKQIISGILPISIITISLPKLKAAIKMHQIERLEGVVIEKVTKANFRGE